jgi:deazaflavin-dependent oxidoreductase (nitroreductase family)
MPEGLDTWVVLGSNYGLEKHPAWTSNLLAHPTEAEISWRGRSIPVTGRLLEGQERQAVWERAVRFWPPYATYQTRCRREIRVFLLTRR